MMSSEENFSTLNVNLILPFKFSEKRKFYFPVRKNVFNFNFFDRNDYCTFVKVNQ